MTEREAATAQRLITSRNRLVWAFLLRKARGDGRTWAVYAVTLEDDAA